MVSLPSKSFSIQFKHEVGGKEISHTNLKGIFTTIACLFEALKKDGHVYTNRHEHTTTQHQRQVLESSEDALVREVTCGFQSHSLCILRNSDEVMVTPQEENRRWQDLVQNKVF